MREKDFIKFCRYYHGEKECHYTGNKATFWQYEKKWVEFNLSESGKDMLATYIQEYTSCGLALFATDDDTPVSLKALLLNRYGHWSGLPMYELPEPFKEFYINDYIKGSLHVSAPYFLPPNI